MLVRAPLLPVRGLPLFWLSFPRPARFWPFPARAARHPRQHHPLVAADAALAAAAPFFAQALPELQQALMGAWRRGALGAPRAGDVFVLAFHARLAWVTVLEVGFQHAAVAVRGLPVASAAAQAEAAAATAYLAAALDEPSPLRPNPVGPVWRPRALSSPAGLP